MARLRQEVKGGKKGGSRATQIAAAQEFKETSEELKKAGIVATRPYVKRKPVTSVSVKSKRGGGGSAVVAAKMQQYEKLRPKTASETTTNKYLNNPNFIVERREDGTLKEIRQKPVRYLAVSQAHGTGRVYNTYSPMVLEFNEDGHLISQKQYDKYNAFYRYKNGTQTTNIYLHKNITFDPDGWKKQYQDWQVITKESGSGKTYRESVKNDELKKFDPSGQTTFQQIETWGRSWVTDDSGNVRQKNQKTSKTVNNYLTGERQEQKYGRDGYSFKNQAKAAWLGQQVGSGKGTSMSKTEVNKILRDSKSRKAYTDAIKTYKPGVSSKSLITDLRTQSFFSKGPSVSFTARKAPVIDSKFGAITVTSVKPEDSVFKKQSDDYVTQTLSWKPTYSAGGLKDDRPMLQATKTLLTDDKPATITNYADLTDKSFFDRVGSTVKDVGSKIWGGGTITGDTVKDTTKTTTVADVLKAIESPESVVDPAQIPTGQIVDPQIALKRIATMEPTVKGTTTTTRDIGKLIDTSFSDPMFNVMTGQAVKDTTSTQTTAPLYTLDVTQKNLVKRIADYNLRANDSKTGTFLDRDETEMKQLEIEREKLSTVLKTTGGVNPDDFLTSLGFGPTVAPQKGETDLELLQKSFMQKILTSQGVTADPTLGRHTMDVAFDMKEAKKWQELKERKKKAVEANINAFNVDVADYKKTGKADIANKKEDYVDLVQEIKAYNEKEKLGTATPEGKKYLLDRLEGAGTGDLRFIQATIDTPNYLLNEKYKIGDVSLVISGVPEGARILGDKIGKQKLFKGVSADVKESDRAYDAFKSETGAFISSDGKVHDPLAVQLLNERNKKATEISELSSDVLYSNENIIEKQTRLYGTDVVSNTLKDQYQQQQALYNQDPTPDKKQALDYFKETYDEYLVSAQENNQTGLLTNVENALTKYKTTEEANNKRPTQETYDTALKAWTEYQTEYAKFSGESESYDDEVKRATEANEALLTKTQEISTYDKAINSRIENLDVATTAFNTTMKNVGQTDRLKVADQEYKEMGWKGLPGRGLVALAEFGRETTKFVGAPVFQYQTERGRGTGVTESLKYSIPGIAQAKSIYDWREQPQYRKVDWQTVMGGVNVVLMGGALVKGVKAAKYPLSKAATKLTGRQAAKVAARRGVVKGVVYTALGGAIVVPEAIQVARGQETIGGAGSDIFKSVSKLAILVGATKAFGKTGTQIGKQQFVKIQQQSMASALQDPGVRQLEIVRGGKGELFLQKGSVKAKITEQMQPFKIKLGGKLKGYELQVKADPSVTKSLAQKGTLNQQWSGNLQGRLVNTANNQASTQWLTFKGQGADFSRLTTGPSGSTQLYRGEQIPLQEVRGRSVGRNLYEVVDAKGKTVAYKLQNTRGYFGVQGKDIDMLSNRDIKSFANSLGLKNIKTKTDLKKAVEFMRGTEIGKTYTISKAKFNKLQDLDKFIQGVSGKQYDMFGQPALTLQQQGVSAQLAGKAGTTKDFVTVSRTTGMPADYTAYTKPPASIPQPPVAGKVKTSVKDFTDKIKNLNLINKRGSLTLGRGGDIRNAKDATGGFFTGTEQKQSVKYFDTLEKTGDVRIIAGKQTIPGYGAKQIYSPYSETLGAVKGAELSALATQYFGTVGAPSFTQYGSLLAYRGAELAKPSDYIKTLSSPDYSSRLSGVGSATLTGGISKSATKVDFGARAPVVSQSSGSSGGDTGTGGGSGPSSPVAPVPVPPIVTPTLPPGYVGPFIPGLKGGLKTPMILGGWGGKIPGFGSQKKTPQLKTWLVVNPVKDLQGEYFQQKQTSGTAGKKLANYLGGSKNAMKGLPKMPKALKGGGF